MAWGSGSAVLQLRGGGDGGVGGNAGRVVLGSHDTADPCDGRRLGCHGAVRREESVAGPCTFASSAALLLSAFHPWPDSAAVALCLLRSRRCRKARGPPDSMCLEGLGPPMWESAPVGARPRGPTLFFQVQLSTCLACVDLALILVQLTLEVRGARSSIVDHTSFHPSALAELCSPRCSPRWGFAPRAPSPFSLCLASASLRLLPLFCGEPPLTRSHVASCCELPSLVDPSLTSTPPACSLCWRLRRLIKPWYSFSHRPNTPSPSAI